MDYPYLIKIFIFLYKMTGEIRSMFDINFTENKEKEEASKKIEIEASNKKKEIAKRYS
jgi:hypothetical protein